MDAILQDLRYAFRALLRQPAVTIGVTLTLALGVGLNGAVFSIVNAYLFRPLPARAPEQLVLLGQTSPELAMPHEMSWPDIDDQRRLPVYQDVAVWVNQSVNLGSGVGGRPERAFIYETSANFFSLLGVPAAIGRTFLPGEDRDAGAHRVLILDHDFWVRHFAGDSTVIGRTIAINGQSATIIGVLPATFHGVQAMLGLQAYMPLNQVGTDYASQMQQRDGSFLNVVARLAPGVRVAEARAASEALAARIAAEHPDTHRGTGIVVLAEKRARPLLFIAQYTPLASAVFLALTALVLVVACANIAGLLLSRAAARERELAVRAALGAGRGRIARLLLIESLLLGGLGGVAALAVAVWSADALSALRLATDFPVRFDVAPDWRVFAFTLAVALVASALAGMAPAWRGAAADLHASLRAGARVGGVARQRLRSVLVVAQVAVGVVVLAAAGMFLRSTQRASKLDLGYRTDGLLLASLSLGDQGYDKARAHGFADRLVERAAALPGVQGVALARRTPIGYNNSFDRVVPEGGMASGDANLTAFTNEVSAGYFGVMGIGLVSGRTFGPVDDSLAPRSAIVSQAFAQRAWGSGSAIGRRFREVGDSTPVTVVGVVRNTVWMSVGEEPRPFIYYPLSQRSASDITLHLRSSGDPATLAPAVRAAVLELDADLPLYDVRTFRQHLDGGRALFSLRIGAAFTALFGALAATLGAVGLFGLIAFGVTQRTREIGIRLALGANAAGVQGMMMRRGLVLVAIGLAVGLPVAALLGRAMQGLLVATPPVDPLALGGAGALLLLVAAVAAWLPARRAARVDPMEALRSE